MKPRNSSMLTPRTNVSPRLAAPARIVIPEGNRLDALLTEQTGPERWELAHAAEDDPPPLADDRMSAQGFDPIDEEDFAEHVRGEGAAVQQAADDGCGNLRAAGPESPGCSLLDSHKGVALERIAERR